MVEIYITKELNTICIEFELDDHYAKPLPYGYSYMYCKYHNIIGISTAYKKSIQSELVQELTSLHKELTKYTEDNYEAEFSVDAYGSDFDESLNELDS